MKSIMYYVIAGTLLCSCADQQEKQLLGKWNIEEMRDFTEKKIIPGQNGYIEFLGNGKVKMNDSEGTYKKGAILIGEDKNKSKLEIDSVKDYLYITVFENDKKKGGIILSKEGSVHPESDKEETYDFRKVKWGMSREQVLASERGEQRKWSDNFVFVPSTNVAGMKSSVGYNFVNDTLLNAGATIAPNYSDGNDYIVDYNKLVEILNAKYGKGESQEYWRNTLYKSNPNLHGVAVQGGDVDYYTNWTTEASDIELVLSCENSKVELRLKYFSNKYKYLLEQKAKKEDNAGL